MRSKISLLIVLCVIALGQINAQSLDDLVESESPEILRKMDYHLWKMDGMFKENQQSAINYAELNQIYFREDGKMKLEVVRGHDVALTIDAVMLENIGFDVDGVFMNRCNVWMSMDELVSMAEKLPAEYFLYKPIPPAPATENQPLNGGPVQMNSSTYVTAGNNLNIAVFDSGFDLYSNAAAVNQVPQIANITYYSHGNGTLESGNQQHGTACTEIVFDHASSATYFLHKLNSLTDIGNAVTNCLSDNIHIITHSLAWFNTGWANNSGAACVAANTASNNDIFFFTAAGNYNDADLIQEAGFTDDGDNWHNWSGSDELNTFTLPNNCSINAYLQWQGAPDDEFDDYDLYLYLNGSSVASSQNTTSFESLSFANNSGATLTLSLAVWQGGSDNNPFELVLSSRGCNTALEYFSTTNNTLSPTNATGAFVEVVGAVDSVDYDAAEGANVAEDFSSIGPTNIGTMNLDFAGPDRNTTIAYGGPFSGTSCATPNVAGAVAAFWSGHSFLSIDGVQDIMRAKAAIYKDWGTAGRDNTFGYGGLYLYDFGLFNRYILSSSNNTSSSGDLPYYTMDDIDDDAGVPENSVMIYLEPFDISSPGVIDVVNRPMIYKSIEGTVVD